MTPIPDDIIHKANALRSAVNWSSNGSVEHIARALMAERRIGHAEGWRDCVSATLAFVTVAGPGYGKRSD